MASRFSLALLTLLLGACAGADKEIANQDDGRCLYVIDRTVGRDTKWGACTTAPPCAVERLTGDDRSRIGAGC